VNAVALAVIFIYYAIVFVCFLEEDSLFVSHGSHNFLTRLREGRGSLVKARYGFIWWESGGPIYEPGEKICLLVDSRVVGEPFHEGSRGRVAGTVVKSPATLTALHAAIDSGGDYFLQLSVGDRLVWVETHPEAIEFL